METSVYPTDRWFVVTEQVPPLDPDKYKGSIDVIVKDDADVTALGYYDFDSENFCSALNRPQYWKIRTPQDDLDIPTYDA